MMHGGTARPTIVDLPRTALMRNETGQERKDADEQNLIQRIRQGETDRFEDVIRRYQGHVVRLVSRRVPAADVEEVAHDVFIRAYVGLAQYSQAVGFDHWLSGIAVRACVDFWRARKRTDLPVSHLTSDHHQWIEEVLASRSDEDFRSRTRQREAADVLDWALGQLSPENRAVLTLVYLEGHSVRDAAHLLGMSVVTVKVRAHRARRLLREILSQHMKEGT